MESSIEVDLGEEFSLKSSSNISFIVRIGYASLIVDSFNFL